MIDSASPRRGEPRPHLFAAPQVTAPSAAALAKMRWAKHSVEMADVRQGGFEIPLPASLAGRLEKLAPTDDGLRRFLDELGRAVRAKEAGLSDAEAFAAGLPLEPATTRRIPERHVQSLLADFRQRQRQANVLVTACVGSCFVLTVLGVALLANFVGREPGTGGAKHATSVSWQEPTAQPEETALVLAAAMPDRSLKSEALPARAIPDDAAHPQSSATPEMIILQDGRELALAPLLAQRQAPYLLVRGLPDTATLSAGQRNPSGAWLIKNEDLGQLTLTVAGSSSGDYPLEIYALGEGALAQARQRLVIRVEPALNKLSADELNWPAALGGLALKHAEAASPAAPSGKSPERLRTLASLGG